MNPAYSVIIFTTLSGAGYGLLIWLSVFCGLGKIDNNILFGLIAFGLALMLISVGLLSSMMHLGHPERAWRALSQWRSSWLSREGVAAVVTYAPAIVFGAAWSFIETSSLVWVAIALLTAVGALITVYCTGMIYASLRTIRQWHLPIVPAIYIVLALATGGLLLSLLLQLFGQASPLAAWISVLFLVSGLLLKNYYWKLIDHSEPRYTAGSAIGIPHATVRPLDPPHSQPNYVMREMGYSIGRKHAKKLRLLSNAFGFVIPIVFVLVSLFIGQSIAVFFTLLAVLSVAVGIAIERWLFFAEAQHVSMLYYGATTA